MSEKTLNPKISGAGYPEEEKEKAAVTETSTSQFTEKEKESVEGEGVSPKKGTKLGSANNNNPFLDPTVAEYYRKLYEDSKYECREAFDPELEWSAEEEKKLIRKLDFRVALTACFLFVGLQVDRVNLSQAVSDNMLEDLGMNTNQYNTGNTIFYVSFLFAEIPSNLISKALGPDRFIPFQIAAWSVVVICQGALLGMGSFYATRCLIGVLEGGFIPDIVLWLSYFYKSHELSIRLSWFWTTLALASIITLLLAFAILRMRGVCDMAGWRWLFILEGICTFLIGISGFYLMVPSVVQTRNKLHPKGWFTRREELVSVNRVLRDDPSKGDMHNRQAISFKGIFKALIDYDLWPLYIIGILAYIPSQTIQPYITLSIKSLGFSTFVSNVLVIPGFAIQIIGLLSITWLSEKINERALLCLVSAVWSIVCTGVLAFWKESGISPWGSWALRTLILGTPYVHAIAVAWVSRNSNSIKTRSVSSAAYNVCVQLGTIVGVNLYRKNDAPRYLKANKNLFCISVAMIPMFILTKLYYVWRNSMKEKKWRAMSEEERIQYSANSMDGNKRLDFRFAH